MAPSQPSAVRDLGPQMSLHTVPAILLEYGEGLSQQLGIKGPWLLVKLEKDKAGKLGPHTRPSERGLGRTGLATSQRKKARRRAADH